MIVFRLCKKAYRKDLSGRGAEISGGRWNGKGVAVLYTSSSRALCALEIAVHTPAGILPKDYYIITIEFPDDEPVAEIFLKDLPDNWTINPIRASTQHIGNAFIDNGNALILKVPSATVKGDFNYLINPAHTNFGKVKIIESEPFAFDARLFSPL